MGPGAGPLGEQPCVGLPVGVLRNTFNFGRGIFLRNYPLYRRMLFGVHSNYTMNDHLDPALSGSNLEFACRGRSSERLLKLAKGFSPERSVIVGFWLQCK